MKFKDLPPGARFRYQGLNWTRTGPLVAVSEEGTERVLPRWAVVEPLAGDAPEAGPAGAAPVEVLAVAVDRLQERLTGLARSLSAEAGPVQPARLEAAIAEALDRFRAEAGLPVRRRP